jgi:hypothetical protein
MVLDPWVGHDLKISDRGLVDLINVYLLLLVQGP